MRISTAIDVLSLLPVVQSVIGLGGIAVHSMRYLFDSLVAWNAERILPEENKKKLSVDRAKFTNYTNLKQHLKDENVDLHRGGYGGNIALSNIVIYRADREAAISDIGLNILRLTPVVGTIVSVYRLSK